MVILTVENIRHVMSRTTDAKIFTFLEPLNSAMRSWSISTSQRAAMFIAQVAHESMELTHLSENLYYSSPERIMAVWPSRFKTVDEASPYAKNPEALANNVYSNRMGNGDEASGDGWKFRGRGLIQLTGRKNYRDCSRGIGKPVDINPDLLFDPVCAADSAGWFWFVNGLNEMADDDDINKATRRINGGLNGLEDRKRYWRLAKEVIQ